MIAASICTLLLAVGRVDDAPVPRKVYALHSGVHILLSHPDRNHAAKVLGRELMERGIAERDIIVLDNPFPEAGWKSMVPRDGVTMFLDSMAPASRTAQDAYRNMDRKFREHGVGPKDEIAWIGHSAGGQMGLTMAHLAANRKRYPDLEKSTKPYRFHTVITLGTPVSDCFAPDEVRVRHYFSPQDKVVRIVCDGFPWILPSMGYKCTLTACPATPNKNSLVRLWYDVEHPDWIYEPRVLDRVMEDIDGKDRMIWSEPRASLSVGPALAHMLGRMLEENHRLVLEELP